MEEIQRNQPFWLVIAREHPFITYVPIFSKVLKRYLKDSSSAITSSTVEHLFPELSTEVIQPILEKTVKLSARDGGYREVDQEDPFSSRLFTARFEGTRLLCSYAYYDP